MNINKCRSCKKEILHECLDLGYQTLTGVFPKNKQQKIKKGELKLWICENCSLLQLSRNFDKEAMYGNNYGYMSSLNPTMVNHLKSKAKKLQKRSKLNSGDMILDIGSNDSTFLNFFKKSLYRVGVDPTIKKFKHKYKDIVAISDFFSKNLLKKNKISKKAKLVTSIAMFYDLEDPMSFAEDIFEILEDDGIWHFEQSYMPSMIKNVSYDTICHEHLEYYSLKSLMYILNKTNFKIIDIELNKVNGGSFSVSVVKKNCLKFDESPLLDWILKKEDIYGYNKISRIKEFSKSVYNHKKIFRDLILNLNDMNKKVYGYGASTKGNVILQFCHFNEKNIKKIVDVNPYKKNKFTPGTNIKIIDENDFKKDKPDYLVILPWHFRDFIIDKEKKYLNEGGHLIFPLPEIEII